MNPKSPTLVYLHAVSVLREPRVIQMANFKYIVTRKLLTAILRILSCNGSQMYFVYELLRSGMMKCELIVNVLSWPGMRWQSV